MTESSSKLVRKSVAGGFVISDAPRSESFAHWKMVLLCSGGVVLLLVGGAIWKFEFAAHSTKKVTVDPGQQQALVLEEASRYEQTGDVADEQAVLAAYLKANPPKQYQYQPLMLLGTIAFNKHDLRGAIADYKQAEAENGKMQEYDAAAIAEAAQAAGDKATAIFYYKQAIKLTQVQPGVTNSIDDYKASITYLGGTP